MDNEGRPQTSLGQMAETFAFPTLMPLTRGVAAVAGLTLAAGALSAAVVRL